MSVEAMAWALHAPVGGNSKVALLGIANHASADGTDAWPSLDLLASYGHCHRSTVRRAVRELIEIGFILPDGQGPSRTTRYRLPLWLDFGRRGPRIQSSEWTKCVYCEEQSEVLDHLLPKALGGEDGHANRVPSCRSCNGSKGALPLDRWIESEGLDRGGVLERIRRYQNNTYALEGGTTGGTGGGTTATGPEPSLEPSLETPPNGGDPAQGQEELLSDPTIEALKRWFVGLVTERRAGNAPQVRQTWNRAARELAAQPREEFKAVVIWALDSPYWVRRVNTLPKLAKAYPDLRAEAVAAMRRERQRTRRPEEEAGPPQAPSYVSYSEERVRITP